MMHLLAIMLIVVLYNHLGLSDEVASLVHAKGKVRVILTCSKCQTFWISLCYIILYRWSDIAYGLLIPFLMSYLSLWIELLLAYLSITYYRCYGKIYPTKEDSTKDTTTD